MSNLVIPDKAVVAAAKAMFGENVGPAYNLARAALEAAEPYISAEAWSTCAVESARCGLLSAADALMLANRNPYRSDA